MLVIAPNAMVIWTNLVKRILNVSRICDSYREVEMYSDDDYYEDEYSGYGHTGDPNLDRWGLERWIVSSLRHP